MCKASFIRSIESTKQNFSFRSGPLREHKNKTVIVTLPAGESVSEYDSLSIWSIVEEIDYGYVMLPENIKVPPSPRSLQGTNDFQTVIIQKCSYL